MTGPVAPRQRAAELRLTATRNRRAADRIAAAIAHPDRHPAPTPGTTEALDLWHRDRTAYQLAIYAARPPLGRAAIRQLHDLADAYDRQATHLTRRATHG